ncbi:unnamed protein product [Lymnaea stagnalis]|uniref:Carrier domain-containing protein n=1 Tax=Lymnaea stagnalis TaxID=6523 RepID=A0AAV2I1K9_LYMST
MGTENTARTLTYKDLGNQITELRLGFEGMPMKNQIVAVCLEECLEIPSILLGLISCSCAFHPFNLKGISYTAKALNNVGASWIIVHLKFLTKLSSLINQLNGVEIESEIVASYHLKAIKIQTKSLPTCLFEKLDLAYCITTSGTTSAPKVVKVPHDCIVPNIINLRDTFHLVPGDKVLLTSPLTFDPSIIDIFCTLSSGACLLIVPEELKRRPRKLLDVIHDQAVSVMQATPSLIRTFPPSNLQNTLLGPASNLRILALGGEPFPSGADIHVWLHKDNRMTQFYNLYGITEVSCWTSCQHVDIQKYLTCNETPSIGKPLDKTEIELKNRGEQNEGEIWIGSSKRICYIDDEGCPTSMNRLEGGVQRSEIIVWRNSGDLGRLKEDGGIVYIGRRDEQVKRFGKRLNLMAIEAIVKTVTGIADCAVLSKSTQLIAFIHMAPADWLEERSHQSHSDQNNSSHFPSIQGTGDTLNSDIEWADVKKTLEKKLSEALPSHYMPDLFVKVTDGFPLTMHGKLDKRKLISLADDEMKDQAKLASQNPLLLAQDLWMTCLPGITNIDPTDNFISLGGDSLAALRVINKLGNLFNSASLPQLFDTLISRSFTAFVSMLESCLQADCNKTHVDGFVERDARNTTDSSELNNLEVSRKRVKDLEDHSIRDLRQIYPADSLSVNSSGKPSKKVLKLIEENSDNEINQRPLTGRQDIHNTPGQKEHASGLHFLIEQKQSVSELRRMISRGSHVVDRMSRIADSCPCEEKHKNKEIHSEQEPCSEIQQSFATASTATNPSFSSQLALHDTSVKDPNSESCSEISGKGDISHRTGNVDLKLRWIHNTGKCVDGSPLVLEYQDKTLVFVGSHSGQFSALDAETGVVLWTVTLPDRIESSACSDLQGAVVVVGCYDGVIYVLNARTGHREWTFATGDMVKCSPVLNLVTGHIVCGSHDGTIYCMDLNVKRCIWEVCLNGGSVFSSPVLDLKQCFLYAATLGGKVTALTADAGLVKWTCDLGKPIFSSLCICNESILVGCVDGCLYCLSASGYIEWTFQTQAPIFSTPTVHDSSIFFGSHDHRLYHLKTNGEVVWTFETSNTVYSTGFVVLHWWQEDTAKNKAPLYDTAVDVRETRFLKCDLFKTKVLVTASSDGNLYVMDVLRGHLLAQVKLPGDVFSSPVVVDNHVIVGCRDNLVYCYDLT